MLAPPPKSLGYVGYLAYAAGMAGWSILVNVIAVIVTYLYLPPNESGLPALITQATVLGIFNAVAIATAGGRLLDAFYDPLVARWSDGSTHPKGRRIPFMRWAILPSVVFCFLVFYPPSAQQSGANIAWLVATLALFYVASTTYIIPYNALLPELAATSDAKVKLSAWQSAGYVVGIGVSSNTFNLAQVFAGFFQISDKLKALQLAVLAMCVLGGLCMLITALYIDEKTYCRNAPSSVPLKEALRQTLSNRNFMLFTVADFSYFMAVTLITSGLLYFLKALLALPESEGNKLMITMVLVSFLFYPVTGILAARYGKKRVVLFSFLLLALVFIGISALGFFPFTPRVQIYSLVAVAAIPLATLNILPNAILASIIEKDSASTGQNKEAVYFAVRYFFVKVAQTFGIAVFAILLNYGKDATDNLGVRLTGVFGSLLCVLALLIFIRFKDE